MFALLFAGAAIPVGLAGAAVNPEVPLRVTASDGGQVHLAVGPLAVRWRSEEIPGDAGRDVAFRQRLDAPLVMGENLEGSGSGDGNADDGEGRFRLRQRRDSRQFASHEGERSDDEHRRDQQENPFPFHRIYSSKVPVAVR